MPYRFAFLIEHTLGHVTHGRNLAEHTARDPSVEAAWLPIHYAQDDVFARMPLVRRNWTLKLSLRARAALARAAAASRPHAVLFHTQVIAHAAHGLMRSIPSIVSLDATPANRLAAGSAAQRLPRHFGQLKRAWTASVFRRADAVVAWSRWAAVSVVGDYAIKPDRVHVIRPGVNLEAWRPRPALRETRPATQGGPIRLLFVGGDFARKGGRLLLSALSGELGRAFELDIVTRDASIIAAPGVRVHRGLQSNASELRALFAAADAFVLPTDLDFTPLAIVEAMASGLPVVASDVGAINEQVADGTTGVLVPRRDGAALLAALRSLADPARRSAMGAAGRAAAEERFCAARNTAALLALLKHVADARAGRSAAAPVPLDIRPWSPPTPRPATGTP